MNKIKVVKKADLTMIVLKSEKGQQLNENEVYLVNSDNVQGLLQMDVEMKGSSFKLVYNIAGMITMQEYLQVPMNKEKFAWILQNILWTLESMDKVFLNQHYLLLSVDKVMVNPVNRQIYFVYVPVQFFESGCSLREFLLEIIQYSRFGYDVEADYVQEYISILNRGINFSIFDLEEYVDKLLDQAPDEKQGKVSPKSCVHSENETRKSLTGQGKSGSNGVYNPLDICGDTGMLGATVCNKVHCAFLLRVKNGQRIPVNKATFRIGKGVANNEYVISDNPTVSRSHAQIVLREGRYFLTDLKSMNKTYVDGIMVPAECEIEIVSGAKIKMSDEEFLFWVE